MLSSPTSRPALSLPVSHSLHLYPPVSPTPPARPPPSHTPRCPRSSVLPASLDSTHPGSTGGVRATRCYPLITFARARADPLSLLVPACLGPSPLSTYALFANPPSCLWSPHTSVILLLAPLRATFLFFAPAASPLPSPPSTSLRALPLPSHRSPHPWRLPPFLRSVYSPPTLSSSVPLPLPPSFLPLLLLPLLSLPPPLSLQLLNSNIWSVHPSPSRAKKL